MGLWDNYRSMVSAQMGSVTQGRTTALGWAESFSQFVEFGILIALCVTHQWWLGVALLVIALVLVVVAGFRK